MVLSVSLERQAHVPAIRIPDSVIEDASLVGRLRDAWLQGLEVVEPEHVADRLVGISALLRAEASERLAGFRESERRLRRSLALLQRLQERGPCS